MSETSRIDITALPNLAEWARSDPAFSPLVWLYAEQDVETAVAFTALFWPDLIEHEGGVFLRAFFDTAAFASWQERLGDDMSAIERAMNHRHIGDLLPGSEKVGSANLLHLGQVLTSCWRACLAANYPDRTFTVQCNDAPEDEDVVIFFCQSR